MWLKEDRQRKRVDEYSRAYRSVVSRGTSSHRIRRVACTWCIVGRRLLLSKAISKTLSRELIHAHAYACTRVSTHACTRSYAGIKTTFRRRPRNAWVTEPDDIFNVHVISPVRSYFLSINNAK